MNKIEFNGQAQGVETNQRKEHAGYVQICQLCDKNENGSNKKETDEHTAKNRDDKRAKGPMS